MKLSPRVRAWVFAGGLVLFSVGSAIYTGLAARWERTADERALVTAIHEGRIAEMQRLIRKSGDANRLLPLADGNEPLTALAHAIGVDPSRRQIVRSITLPTPVSVNGYRLSPAPREVILGLLAAGADPRHPIVLEGQTTNALKLVAAYGDLDTFKYLLSNHGFHSEDHVMAENAEFGRLVSFNPDPVFRDFMLRLAHGLPVALMNERAQRLYAAPVLAEVEQAFRRQDVAGIERAIHALRGHGNHAAADRLQAILEGIRHPVAVAERLTASLRAARGQR